MATKAFPHNLQSERAVLGACLLDIDFQKFAARTLVADDFYDARHKEVFRFIQKTVIAGEPIDTVIFLDRVPKATQDETAVYIDAIPSLGTASHHLQIIREQAIRRRLALGARDIYRAAMDESLDIHEVTETAYQKVRECTTGERIAVSDPEIHQEAYEQMVRSWGGLPLFSTGIDELDDDIGGGIFPGEIMVLVGGEGSMKTSLALHAADHYLQNVGRKVLFLSLDMPAYQINNRRLMPIMNCNEKAITEHAINDTEEYRIARAKRNKIDKGLFRVVHGEYTISDLERIIQFEMPSVVILDYMTAVSGFDDELSAARSVTAALRRWKREFGCAFLILNQMSEIALANQRKGDVGTGRGLGGGSLRRAADVVLELFRDKVEHETAKSFYAVQPRIVCSVVKTRRGSAGKHWSLHYTGETMKFLGSATRVKLRNKRNAETVYTDLEFPE
jgi:replicative DNA helicase